MTAFSSLSELVRSFYALWSLLLCFFSLANLVLAFQKRKWVLGVSGIVLFAPSYLLYQVIFDYSLSKKNGGYSSFSEALVAFPWLLYLGCFLLLLFLNGLIFAFNIHYEVRSISVNAIKSYLDQVDFGICCYKENGRVVFSNIRMNEICLQLMGSQLLNGNQFHEAIKEEVLPIGEKKWRFSFREVSISGEKMTEIISSDVTSEANKTQILEQDRSELFRIKKELQDYYRGIDEMVRRQEILQAKRNVHDEMNHLMLSSLALEDGDVTEMDKVFRLWEENASLLFKEAEQEKEGTLIRHIDDLAESLKIDLLWKKSLPESLDWEKKNLILLTAQEALANASKHAHAKKISIDFKEKDGFLDCLFQNDGEVKEGPVSFTGGLSNLQELAKKEDASLKAEAGDGFLLTLSFPIKK